MSRLTPRQQRLQASRAAAREGRQVVLVAMTLHGERWMKLVPERDALQAAERWYRTGKVWTLMLGGTAFGPTADTWIWKRERVG